MITGYHDSAREIRKDSRGPTPETGIQMSTEVERLDAEYRRLLKEKNELMNYGGLVTPAIEAQFEELEQRIESARADLERAEITAVRVGLALKQIRD